ncbi:MAG TPA: adenylate/guanylate cyclase domain-containing protein [Acidimicrobiia bacterium]|nr:adenylate/guanylate cyclase domain-containing protein [Acidimicrobiia bacterium]
MSPSNGSPLPSGTVTFLFMDIEGSTRLLERLQDDYPQLLGIYRELTEEIVGSHHGAVFGAEGDGLFAAFPEAGEAVSSAIDAQRSFEGMNWPGSATVKVRMGVHSGSPTLIGDDYTGIDVHRTARIMSAAWGGQVLLSEATRSLISDLDAECRELGVYVMKGLSRSERLYQLAAGGLRSEFPPVRARRQEVELPSSPTDLIGRDDEIEAVVDLIEGGARLVTLTGPGGVGKSRLATVIAARLGRRFADGIGYVDLSNHTDPEEVPNAIEEQLGVSSDPTHPGFDLLADHLAPLKMLLVLDGFERVSAAAVGIADLLAQSPDLRILITSRAALRVGAEHEFRVGSLEWPAEDATYEQIGSSPAVRLFVARAGAVRPGFRLSPDNAGAVRDLVARLEGSPLSIELAAARARLLPPKAIVESLGGVLDLATTSPDLPSRQRSLRTAIEWSHGLLPQPDQALLGRLGVFVDGWTLGGAEAVAGEDAPNVFLGLENLAAHSMISVDDDGRMSMSSVLREFAVEQLAASGAEEETRLRHAEHFDSVLAEAYPLMKGPHQPQTVITLSRDWPNIRTAAAWALRTERIELAASLYFNSWILVWQGDFWHDSEAYSSLFAAVSDRLDDQLRAQILFVTSGFRMERGDWREAITPARSAIELARDVGDREIEAWARLMLAGSIQFSDPGDPEAHENIFEAVALARSLDDPFLLGYALSFQGAVATLEGDLATGLASHEEALELGRRLDIVSLMTQTYSQGAMTHLTAGDVERARKKLEDGAELLDRVRSHEALAVFLDAVAWLAFAENDPVRAMTALGAAGAARSKVGLTRWALLAELLEAAGLAAETEQPALAEARSAGAEMTPRDAIVYALQPHRELAVAR